MIRIFSLIIYKILFIIDKFFKFLTRKGFLVWFKEFFQKDSYKNLQILDYKVIFFVPNRLTEWRVDTFFTKEPETIEWINNFEKKDGIIFWDIGSNIGLFSIYNALKNKNSSTISFEPSSSNLRVLTRNISINKLENKIKLFPIALTNKENLFLKMNESEFTEGGAMNSFGGKFDFEGKKFVSKMNYTTFGTSISYLIENKILELPDYIKIDVDGTEHFILEGARDYLNHKKIKEVFIEINENFNEQFKSVTQIMDKNGFKILNKKRNEAMFSQNSPYNKTFNYLFIRK